MVHFVDELFATEAISPKIGSIKWKTVCGIGMVSVYFITVAANKNDLFDIYSAAMFKQRGLRKSNICILGIADSYDAAVGLVERMISDSVDNTGDVKKVREYYDDYIVKHT